LFGQKLIGQQVSYNTEFAAQMSAG